MKLFDFGLSVSRYVTSNLSKTESSKINIFWIIKNIIEFILGVEYLGLTEYYAAPEVLKQKMVSEKSDW